MKYLADMWKDLVQNFTNEILVHESYIWDMEWKIHMQKLISYTTSSFHMWN